MEHTYMSVWKYKANFEIFVIEMLIIFAGVAPHKAIRNLRIPMSMPFHPIQRVVQNQLHHLTLLPSPLRNSSTRPVQRIAILKVKFISFNCSLLVRPKNYRFDLCQNPQLIFWRCKNQELSSLSLNCDNEVWKCLTASWLIIADFDTDIIYHFGWHNIMSSLHQKSTKNSTYNRSK